MHLRLRCIEMYCLLIYRIRYRPDFTCLELLLTFVYLHCFVVRFPIQDRFMHNSPQLLLHVFEIILLIKK